MMTRRTFLTAATFATAVGVTAVGSGQAAAAGGSLRLTAHLHGRAVDRETVLQWEARRLQVAANRLKGNLPAALTGDLDALLVRPATNTANVALDRQRLADAKMRLGETGLRELTAGDLAVSGPVSQTAALADQWAVSNAGLDSTLGTARGFTEWFVARRDRNDERAMLVACPDHYLIRTPRSGVQEVIEVTGGAVVASRFVIDYADTAGIPVAREPRCAVALSGWARTADGARIGAIRHQFWDNPQGGFSAQLAVVFPAELPPWMFSEHSWHLACEFSNWVSAYVKSVHA